MKDLETIILPVLEMSCAVCANNVERIRFPSNTIHP